MPYIINDKTWKWVVQEVEANDSREPKFATELDAEEMILHELETRLKKLPRDFVMYDYIQNQAMNCLSRINRLKQQ